MSGSPFEMLANRVRKRRKHVAKWARRQGIPCFRIYDRDLPDQPLVVEWYDGDAVVWAYDRKRDDDQAADLAWLTSAVSAVRDALELDDEHVFVKRRRRQKGRQRDVPGAGQYMRLGGRRHVREVREGDLSFEVNLSDYLDTGLFLHHRTTRQLVQRASEGRTVLNLFAYTGTFSCHAAAGGAQRVVSVDMSNTYSEWADRNLERNGFLDPDRYRVVASEAFAFLSGARERGESFDLIVCDPPTFSASKSMAATFAVARDHPALLAACAAVLAPGGTLLFSNNARGFQLAESGLPDLPMREITAQTIPEDFRGTTPHRAYVFGAPLKSRDA